MELELVLLYLVNFSILTIVLGFLILEHLNHFDSQEVHFDYKKRPPSIFQIFFRAGTSALFKPEGELPRDVKDIPKSSASIIAPTSIGKVKKYLEATGFQLEEKDAQLAEGNNEPQSVPVCYPEVVSIRLMAILIANKSFPLSALGMIHVGNTIVQYAELPKIGEDLNVNCKVNKWEKTERGIEVYIDSELVYQGKVVWVCTSTLLSRNKSTRSKKRNTEEEKRENTEVWDKQQMAFVPGDTGLKYAAVSSDYNPHHLYPLTAKLIGYPKPIAHGMWTLAACLNSLQSRIEVLKFPLKIEASWKRPILMPCKVMVSSREDPSTSEIFFGVHDKDGQVPHLIGSISSLAPMDHSLVSSIIPDSIPDQDDDFEDFVKL